MSTELVTERTTIADVATRVVRAEGSDDRPVFLFLHGFSDSADGWRRVQRRLADAGFGSLAVDQPAHGEAGPLDADRPVVDQYVEFAAAAATLAAGGEPVVVVGNSLGGAHALALTERHPELVRGCVAISPASFDHPSWFGVLDRPRVRGAERPPRAFANRPVRRAFAGPALRAVAFGRPWRVPRGFVDEWRTRMAEPGRGRAMRALALRVADEYFAGDPVDLTAIRRPVLALWGERDRLTLISSRERFEREVADLTFVPLRGVGHMPQLEVPGLTTKQLLRFAARLEPAPA